MVRESSSGPTRHVHFNVDDDEVLYPKLNGGDLRHARKRRDSIKRHRRSSRADASFTLEADTTLTSEQDEDEEDPDEGRVPLPVPSKNLGSPQLFIDGVHPHVPTFLFNCTEDEGNQDLLDRVACINEDWSTPDLHFPFKPLLGNSQTVIKFDGGMTSDIFQQLVRDHPEEMYDEIRMAYITKQAYKSQGYRFYREALLMNKMAEFLDVWTLHLAVTGNEQTAELTALKDDLAQRRSSLAKARADLVDAIDQGNVIRELNDALADLDKANANLVSKNVENLRLKAKIADLVLEKGRSRSRPGPGGDPSDSSDDSYTPDRNRSRPHDFSREREDTPGSRFSQNDRSAKIADPPVFYNDESKDTVVFASWLRQVKNKLRVNSDHFLSDDAKMVYIEGRLGGKASEDLEPYINETHCEPIKTSEELLKHVYNEYNDHQAADKAIEAFNALDLKVGGDFSAFKNSFVRLAGERGLKRAEWKGEFKRRLPASLQVALAGAYLDKNVDFESYARLGADISFSYQQAHAKRDKEAKAKADKNSSSTGKDSSSSSRRGGRSGRTTSTTASSTTESTAAAASSSGRKELTRDETAQYIREGRCFSCHKTGHTRKDCPDKAAREARINEIAEEIVSKRAKAKAKAAAAASDSDSEN